MVFVPLRLNHVVTRVLATWVGTGTPSPAVAQVSDLTQVVVSTPLPYQRPTPVAPSREPTRVVGYHHGDVHM